MTVPFESVSSKRRSGRLLTAALVLACLLNSCVPAQWEYLVEATDRATQEDVENHFGAPHTTTSLEDSHSLWTYRYETTSSWWGKRGDMVGGLPCTEYLLTFDGQKILKYWVRQDC